MRRIINSTFVSIDGVMTDPQNWPSLGDPKGDFAVQTELLLGCDALLLGRGTYDSFASAWPTRPSNPYTDKINSMAKYVVSSTLDEAEWNNTTVLGSDPVAEITRLKDGPGGDILLYGFGRLAHTLLEHGLLDELRLWVHPFFVGRGGTVFSAGTNSKCDVIETRTLPSGIVLLSYRVKRDAS